MLTQDLQFTWKYFCTTGRTMRWNECIISANGPQRFIISLRYFWFFPCLFLEAFSSWNCFLIDAPFLVCINNLYSVFMSFFFQIFYLLILHHSSVPVLLMSRQFLLPKLTGQGSVWAILSFSFHWLSLLRNSISTLSYPREMPNFSKIRMMNH